MARLFLALEIPTEIQNKIDKFLSPIRKRTKGTKWIKPNQIHLTLSFLGEVEEKLIQTEINPPMKKLCSEIDPFSLQVKGIGFFPLIERAKIFWIGIEEEPPLLKAIQNRIEKELADLPVHQETKAFYPHLTLGRIKSSEDKKLWPQLIKDHEKAEFGSFLAQEIVLFKSTLTTQGSEYTPLERFTFRQI